MRKSLASLILLLSMLGAPGGAAAQHFDCGKAYYPDEKLICHDQRLQQLDQDLTGLYQRRMEQLSDDERDALHNAEINWVRNRRRCGGDYDCVARSYRSRMRQFETTRSDDDIVPPSKEEAAAAEREWERRAGRASRSKAARSESPARISSEPVVRQDPTSGSNGPAAIGSSGPELSPQETGVAVAPPTASPPSAEPQSAEPQSVDHKSRPHAGEKKRENRSGAINVRTAPPLAEPAPAERGSRPVAHEKGESRSGETNVTAAPPAAEPQPAEQNSRAAAEDRKSAEKTAEEKKGTERHSHRTRKAAPPVAKADSDQRPETPVANASAGSANPPKPAPAAGDSRPAIHWVDPNPVH